MTYQYENFVFEIDFQARLAIVLPLIIDCLIIKHKQELYYKKKVKDFELHKEKDFRELLTKYISNMIIIECDFSILLYQHRNHNKNLLLKKIFKSRLMMLFYMVFLTDLTDRKYIYDTIITQNKYVPQKKAEDLYADILYKFRTLRLPYSREEQDIYYANRDMYSIDYRDEIRQTKGLFTRRDLTNDETEIDPRDLFVNYTPKAIYNRV